MSNGTATVTEYGWQNQSEICISKLNGLEMMTLSLRWRHNGRDGVSNHQSDDCLFDRLFRRRSKKTSKVRVTGLCAGNSPGTGEFSAHMASNAGNVFISWRHHVVNASVHVYHDNFQILTAIEMETNYRGIIAHLEIYRRHQCRQRGYHVNIRLSVMRAGYLPQEGYDNTMNRFVHYRINYNNH